MTVYLYRSRPPGIGCQPDGFIVDTRETWLPARTVGTRHFFGKVEYSEPLSFEQIHKFELWPEDVKTRAEMVFWREGDAAEWLRADYLAADVSMLREYQERDVKAWAALVLLEEIKE